MKYDLVVPSRRRPSMRTVRTQALFPEGCIEMILIPGGITAFDQFC